MSLAHTIKQLEQEIIAEKNLIALHCSQAKQQFNKTMASPPALLLAVIGGGFLGVKIKRKFAAKSVTRTLARTKTSLFKRIMALSSETAVIIKYFNRFKPMAQAWLEKIQQRSASK